MIWQHRLLVRITYVISLAGLYFLYRIASVETMPQVVVGGVVLLILPFLFRNLLSVYCSKCGDKLKIWKGKDSTMHPDTLWYEYYCYTCKQVVEYDRSVDD